MTDTTATQSPPEDAQPTGTGPAGPAPQNTRSRAEQYLNRFLAAIVAIYGILTALALLSASQAGGLYYDNVFIAQAHLNDASELAVGALVEIVHDLSVLEQIRVHELSGSDPEIIKFLYGQLSAGAQASLERSGELDETYAAELNLAPDTEREKAEKSFDLAVAWSERAGTYETLAAVLAVGLAFAAWASLMERAGTIRWMFALVAALILLGCLGFLGLHLVTREPLEEYLTFPDSEVHTSVGGPGSTLVGGLYAHPPGAVEFVIPDRV